MTQELQDKLKLVAEKDGWVKMPFDSVSYRKPGIGTVTLDELNYHDDWSKQIPVWAKLNKEYPKECGLLYYTYHKKIDNDKPQEGFEIIVTIIQRIQQ